MTIRTEDIVIIVSLSAFLFFFLLILRHLLFFGFTPFIPHRPEVVEKILKELDIEDGALFYSLGYGRSGFLNLASKKFPQSRFIGVDESFFGTLLSRLQALFKNRRIKVEHRDYYKADLSRANVVYCYLTPEELRDLYKKLKLEPRLDAFVISSGFIIPFLDPIKVIKTEPKHKWYNALIRHKKVFTIKEKEHTRDNNVYFYRV